MRKPNATRDDDNPKIGKLREHNVNIRNLLRHPGLNPNRGLLAEMILMWINTVDGTTEKKFIEDIIRAVWVSPDRVRYASSTEESDVSMTTRTEMELDKQIRSAFGSILSNPPLDNSGGDNASSASNV